MHRTEILEYMLRPFAAASKGALPVPSSIRWRIAYAGQLLDVGLVPEALGYLDAAMALAKAYPTAVPPPISHMLHVLATTHARTAEYMRLFKESQGVRTSRDRVWADAA